MYNFLSRYENKTKVTKYKSILKQVKKNDFSSIGDNELVDKFKSITNINDPSLALSLINEAIFRLYNIKSHDEQIIGAIGLYEGNIIEMKTGEGKTIVAIFASLLHSLNNKKVHIITANDYLANRDFDFSKKIFNFFDVSLSLILEETSNQQKAIDYTSNVVYSTAKNLCFDYLHDTLVKKAEDTFQKGIDVAIVDEIDFVLIDEARIPIAISGKADFTTGIAHLLQKNVSSFILEEAFTIDEKTKNIELTEKGFSILEKLLIENTLIEDKYELYKYENIKYLQLLYQTLKANFVLKKDIDYIIKDNKAVIVDENTGRLLEGRRWSDGLHQAIELKEDLAVKSESKTLASSTLQGYFSKYNLLSGMTGTAKSEELEFKEIYQLDVVQIPPHRPMQREDREDVLFKDRNFVFDRILSEIKENLTVGRPILIGTTSVKDSEDLFSLLQSNNIQCDILNAKNHEKEAHIIENAGKRNHITIATNMAGRGTDIMLGGNKDTEIEYYMLKDELSYTEALELWKKENAYVNSLGGLHIIGVGRSHSRRLDNQLIGRSGRQGDKGSSCFYLSLEDEVLSIFGKPLKFLWTTLSGGLNHVGIADKRVSKQIKEAQTKNEHLNFTVRKNLLKYSQAIEKQSKIISDMRVNVIDSTTLDVFIINAFKMAITQLLSEFNDYELYESEASTQKIKNSIDAFFSDDVTIDLHNYQTMADVANDLSISLFKLYESKKENFESSSTLDFEKNLILEIIDNIWTEHLTALENIRKGTTFRKFAQKDPFDEFKNEAFSMFGFLLKQIYIDTTTTLYRFDPIDFLNKINYNSNENFTNKNMFLGNKNRAGF